MQCMQLGKERLYETYVAYLHVGFFSDTIKARNFNLCMSITLVGVYIVILGLMALALFQGHRFVRNINCKLHFFDSCPL